MRYYPIALNIDGKDVLVVGAGKVAERKVRLLRAFGARVRVVAPQASFVIAGLARRGALELARRSYRSSDIKGARLVIAATSSRQANERVSRDAGKKGALVNVVDHTAACEFISPAIFRKGDVVVSVSTNGKDPKLSRKVKNFLKRKLNEFDLDRHKP